MAFGKKKIVSEEESYYSDYPEEKNEESPSPLPKNLIAIALVALVIIIVIVLALGLLGQQSNLLFFGPDGNKLNANVTISKNGKLIDSFDTGGDAMHLSGNPNEQKKIVIKTSGISLNGKNVSISVKTSGGIITRTLTSDEFFIDENGGVHFTINPFEDLNIEGYLDENTGEYIYTDTNIDVSFELVIEDDTTGETIIIDLPATYFISDYNQDGCIALSRSAFIESTHFGYLDTYFKIRTICDSSNDLVANVKWNSKRVGNVEVVFGKFATDTILFAADQPILTAPSPNTYDVRVIFTPFAENAGEKASFSVNFGLGETASSNSKVDYEIALDNLEQCVRVTPSKVVIPSNQDSATLTVDVSSCASESISISLCDKDDYCSGGTEGGISLSQKMFSLSPKSNASKTITITRQDIAGAYGIPIAARVGNYSKAFIDETLVIVEPKGDELLTPDKFVISLMGGSKDSIVVRNSSLAEDVSVNASVCKVIDNSLGVESSGDNYGVTNPSNLGTNSWWRDLYTNQKKYAGEGKYQASISNTLAKLDYLRATTQIVAANKNSDIKRAYLDIVAEDEAATVALKKAEKSYDDMKILVAKADEWNKFKSADIAMNYASLASSVASFIATATIAETATISAATACATASAAADTTLAGIGTCSPATAGASTAVAGTNAAAAAANIAAGVTSAQLVMQAYSIQQQVQALANPPKDIDYSAALAKAEIYYKNLLQIKEHTSKAREYATASLSAAAVDSFSTISSDTTQAKKYLELAREENDFVVGIMLETQTNELGALTEITMLMQEAQSSLEEITGYISAAVSLGQMIGQAITGHTLVESKLITAQTSLGTALGGSSAAIGAATSFLASCCNLYCQSGCVCPTTIASATTASGTITTANTTVGTAISSLGGTYAQIMTVSSVIGLVQMGYQTWRMLSMDFIVDLQNAQVSGQSAIDEMYLFMPIATKAHDSLQRGISSADWLAENSKDASIAAGYDASIFNLEGEFNKSRMAGLVGDAIANGFVNGAYQGGVYTTKETDYVTSASPLRTAPQETPFADNSLNNSRASFEQANPYGIKEDCSNMVEAKFADYSINLINDAQRINVSNEAVSAQWDFTQAKVFDVFNEQEVGIVFASTGLRNNSYGVVELTANKHSHSNPTDITGKFGPFDIPDSGVEPITYKYHFKFNVAPRFGGEYVSLSNSDCTSGLMRGETSANGLPKTILSWDWNSVAGLKAKDSSKQSNNISAFIGKGGENEPYLDATQLSILLSKKLGSISSLLTESSLECPQNPAKVILSQIKPAFTIEDGLPDPSAANFDPNPNCYLPYTTKEFDGKPALYYFLEKENLSADKEWMTDSEKVSTAEEFLSLVDFNANLMRDGYGIDFQLDFSQSYGTKILLAGPSFLDSRMGSRKYFEDTDRAYFSSKANYDKSATKWALPDAGNYRIRMLIDFLEYPLLYRGSTPSAKIIFDIYSLEPIYSEYNPLYYTPIDGFTGLNANNNRRYYGSALASSSDSIDANPSQGATLSTTQNEALVRPVMQKITNSGLLSSSPYLRSRILDYSYLYDTKALNDSSSQLIFSPTIATPLLFELSGEEGRTTSINYSLSQNGKEYSPKSNSLFLFSYVGDCSDLAGNKLSSYVNQTPDLSFGKSFGAALPSAITSGKTFIKTVAYVPTGNLFGLYTPLNASVYSPNDLSGANESILLSGIDKMISNDAPNNQSPDSISQIFNGVTGKSICVSHQSIRDVYYWSDNILFKTKGSADTSLSDKANAVAAVCVK